MTILQKINKYRKIIRDYINTHPDEDCDGILKHLINEYCNEKTPILVDRLFTGSATTSTLVVNLINALKDEKRDQSIIDILGHYLNDNPINKNEDFFALLVAYYYYFEDIYSNKELQNYTALYQQIFVPLHLYRERVETDNVDALLAQLNRPAKGMFDYSRDNACEMLGNMDIPIKDRKRVITLLLEKVDEKNTGISYKACKVLCKIPIPKDQIDNVFNKLIKKMDDSSCFSYACQALAAMPLSKSRCDTLVDKALKKLLTKTPENDFRVLIAKIAPLEGQLEKIMTKLFENADNQDDEWIRVHACTMLGKVAEVGISEESLEKITDKLIQKLDDPSNQVFLRACWALEGMSIPKSRQEIVVHKLLANANNKDFTFLSGAMAALRKVPIPEKMHEFVIKSLIEKINVSESPSTFISVLGKVPIPKSLHKEVFNMMISKADDNDIWALGALISIADTTEEHEKVTAKILEQLNSPSRDAQENICRLLKQEGSAIPEKQCEKIIAKLLEYSDNGNRSVLYNICDTFGVMTIPKSQCELVVSMLLKMTTIYRGEVDVRARACEALAKVPIPEKQHQEVINILYNIIDKGDGYNPREAKINACKALGEMSISGSVCMAIMLKLFVRGMENDNLKETLGETLTNTLLTLYQKLSIEERTKMVAKLESLEEQVASKNPTKLPYLLFLKQACQGRNAFHGGVASHLPPEKAEEVEKKLR